MRVLVGLSIMMANCAHATELKAGLGILQDQAKTEPQALRYLLAAYPGLLQTSLTQREQRRADLKTYAQYLLLFPLPDKTETIQLKDAGLAQASVRKQYSIKVPINGKTKAALARVVVVEGKEKKLVEKKYFMEDIDGIDIRCTVYSDEIGDSIAIATPLSKPLKSDEKTPPGCKPEELFARLPKLFGS